jgi:hypothetical protein
MKAVAIRREGASVDALVGRVLCYDVRGDQGKVVGDKGALLDRERAAAVLAAPWDELHVVEPEDGDLHEEAAGSRLAAAVVGDGVEVKTYAGGPWTLAATRRGVLRVRTDALTTVNAQEGISVFTLFDLQPVEAGETVAKAKVTPLVIPGERLTLVERVAREASGVVVVLPFQPTTVGAVAPERLEPKQRQRFETALQLKINWFGGSLLPLRFGGDKARTVADQLAALRDEGAELLIVAGASALDPLDPVFGGLALLGARMERHGVPAHPGSLLWLARWEGKAILGMPTCGMFSQATTFDLVLPRLLAGEDIGNPELAALGHGGLLSREMAYRFPPYRAGATRGELE